MSFPNWWLVFMAKKNLLNRTSASNYILIIFFSPVHFVCEINQQRENFNLARITKEQNRINHFFFFLHELKQKQTELKDSFKSLETFLKQKWKKLVSNSLIKDSCKKKKSSLAAQISPTPINYTVDKKTCNKRPHKQHQTTTRDKSIRSFSVRVLKQTWIWLANVVFIDCLFSQQKCCCSKTLHFK